MLINRDPYSTRAAAPVPPPAPPRRLNPHVYLDSVLLLGSVANGYGPKRWLFGLGAIAGSALWFSALGFGARLLRGFFAQPRSWRLLDLLIAGTMTTLGVMLVVGH